jgi:hypothetical protein
MNIPKITCPKKIIEETLKCISNISEDDSSKNTKRIIKDTFEWFFMNNISDDIIKNKLSKSINNTFIHSLEKYQQKFIVNLDLNVESPLDTVQSPKETLEPVILTVHIFIDKLLIEIDINFDLLTDLNEQQHKNKLCVILYAYLIICVYE